MPHPLILFFRSAKVYVNFGRAKHLLRLEDVKFAHQIDQRLRRTLITLQGLVLRDLDHSFRKTYLALLPLHPDRDRLQQRCHKVGRGPCAARPAFGIARGFALPELVLAWRSAVTDFVIARVPPRVALPLRLVSSWELICDPLRSECSARIDASFARCGILRGKL
jgi:hypothetical protein